MSPIGKHSIEYFCFDCRLYDKSEAFQLAIQQQYCKYLQATCFKFRKSMPDIKVGICSVGATVNRNPEIKPVIICPHRFKESTMFETIRLKYLSDWKNVKWIPEVNIGVGGSVDYVAVELDEYGNIRDFLCVEIQAGGTTGSPYYWIENLKTYGKLIDPKKSFGINWANEFSKTMMQQAYKKGKIVERWNRKIVFVIQDVAMDYIMATSDCSKLEEYTSDYPVDFCTFGLKESADCDWQLEFRNIYSTTIDGINTMIGGASVNDYLTEEEFILNILKKGISDGRLKQPDGFL